LTAAPLNIWSQSEDYQSLFEEAPVAYHEIDTNGIVRRVNHTECELLGFTRAEMLGHAIWEFLASQDQSASRDRIRSKMRFPGPIAPSEREFVQRDGVSLTLEVHENHILDHEGQVVGIRTTMLDITSRKRVEKAEEGQRQSEEKYRRFFEEDVAANYIATPGGRLLACNPAFLAMFGFNSAEEARTCPVASLYPRPEARQAFLDLLTQRRQLRYKELELRRTDGRTIYVIENATGTFDERGELTEIRGHLIDVTDRRLKEEALARKTEELARSNAELEQFAYVASHDLQEPLRMVSSYTQLLAKRYKGRLGQDADEFIEFAVDGAKRMQALINDLLGYSRVGTRGGEFQATSSEAAVASASRNLRAAIEESGATICSESLPTVVADPTQLVQLFQNLIGNAIKYRDSAPPEIRVACEECPAELRFTVQDNGIGIDPRYAGRIFQIFQRLHHKKDYPGTGIGLAVCKKIVERHGGRIWVESQPGQGATFCFTIPKNGDHSE